MSFGCHIKISQQIISQRISPTLQNNNIWLIRIHDPLHNRLKQLHVILVFYPLPKWHIKSIIEAVACSLFVVTSRIWKETVSILMKTAGKDTVSVVKCIFNTISVVDINVNVKDSLELGQELVDCNDNIIDVAKPRLFPFLGMMKTPSPINCYICLSIHNQMGAIYSGPCTYTLELKNALKIRIIVQSYLVFFLCHLLWFDIYILQEFYVSWVMKL